MNDYGDLIPRERGKTLLIVEGNHEKNELFWLLFKCFPELKIDFDDVIIYGTNIYMLYDDIVEEYDEDWDMVDVDLPYIVSKKKTPETIQRKTDYINIYIVFDYERHDPNFSEDKIRKLQEYFSDSTDAGQLYLNYPMIESYQDMLDFPDDAFINHKVSVTVRPGSVYKGTIRNSIIARMTGLPQKIREILKERFSMQNDSDVELCMLRILSLNNSISFIEEVKEVLKPFIDERNACTAAYQMLHIATSIGYISENESFWDFMKKIFKKIIQFHICKADSIVSNDFGLQDYAGRYYNIDYQEILDVQNQASRDDLLGFIWVLNTSILLVPDYNLDIVKN